MRILIFGTLCIVSGGLIIVRYKGWGGYKPIKILVDVATIMSPICALLVFVIPAATGPKEVNPNQTVQNVEPVIDNVKQNDNLKIEGGVLQKERDDKPAIAEEWSVYKRDSRKFFDNTLTISVQNIFNRERVSATIGSVSSPNLFIKKENVGYATSYNSNGSVFKVRITGVGNDMLGNEYVRFMVVKLQDTQPATSSRRAAQDGGDKAKVGNEGTAVTASGNASVNVNQTIKQGRHVGSKRGSGVESFSDKSTQAGDNGVAVTASDSSKVNIKQEVNK